MCPINLGNGTFRLTCLSESVPSEIYIVLFSWLCCKDDLYRNSLGTLFYYSVYGYNILVSKGMIKKIVQNVHKQSTFQCLHLNTGKITLFDRKHADLDLMCNATIRDAVYTFAKLNVPLFRMCEIMTPNTSRLNYEFPFE